jgi:hypothetical protein
MNERRKMPASISPLSEREKQYNQLLELAQRYLIDAPPAKVAEALRVLADKIQRSGSKMAIRQGNIVTYRKGETKYGRRRICRQEGLPITKKYVERTDPDTYGMGIVLDVIKRADLKQPQSWAHKCVHMLETNEDKTDFAMVYWCSNSVLEFIDPVFLDVVKEHACGDPLDCQKDQT